jgi:RNA polymerase nonessential primary-like sigma factor
MCRIRVTRPPLGASLLEEPPSQTTKQGATMGHHGSAGRGYGDGGYRRREARASSGGVDVVRLYLDDIGDRPLLDRDGEIRLAVAIERGMQAQARFDAGLVADGTERRRFARQVATGARAHEEFVESNLRLVVSIARRFGRPGVELLDLVQAGNIGLLRAVDGFDWRLGNKFSTYATWWIRQAVIREMGESSRVIRIPLNLLDQIAALHHIQDRLRVELGHEPDVEDVADDAGAPRERVSELLSIGRDVVSLSVPVGDSSELSDLVADKRDADPGDRAASGAERQEIRRLLDHLNDREAAVLRLRYGFDDGQPRSLDYVGQRLGVSPERARQLEARALSHLRFDDAARALRAAS